MARVTILGMSGSGKSYYAGTLLESVVPNFTYAVHFDPEDEEKGLCDVNADPLYSTLEVTPELYRELDFRKVIYNHEKVRIVPVGLTNDEMIDLLGVICASMMHLCANLKLGTGFVSVDEAHNVIPNSSIDERVERFITGGRKHGCEILTLSQRPQLLHKTCISQADRRVYFALNEHNDIKAVNRSASFDANKLSSLPSRRAIVENKDSGEWVEIDTNDVERIRPHYAGDDGVLDDALPV